MKYVKSCLIITMLVGVGYATCDAALGDLNGDTNWNVQDIVFLAKCVLYQDCETDCIYEGEEDGIYCYGCAADVNLDGGWNVLDIVMLANCILASNCQGLEG